jgi:RNA polymerase sigma factor (sigma-70 family)
MRDEEVIEKIKKGDQSAIEFLYTKHYRMMVNVVTKNNGSEDDAKDVYQDALIVFWEKVASGEFVLSSKISTYLYSIVSNLWKKEWNRKLKTVSDDNVDVPVNMLQNSNEQVDAILNCISKLSETCQKVLTMYYFDRLSMGEIADKLDFSSADTAKTKKYKCKKELDSLVTSMYSASDFLD